MNKLTQISHRDIIDYLQNKLSDLDLKRINNIREKDLGYALLFQLIDNCKTIKQTTGKYKHKHTHVSFSDTEQLLINLLSGPFKQADSGYFLNLLMESPDFYSRLMLKLDTIKKIDTIQENDLREIRIKPDAELLAEISAYVKSSRSFPNAAVITIITKLKSLFFIKNDRQTILRYSFVTVSLILFSLVGYMALKPGRIRYEIYNKYFNADTVPLAYDSTLRGPLERADQNTSYDTLLNQFKLGIGDYLRQNYTKALEIFEQILSRQSTIENDGLFPLLREVHFYSGLSCMALAGKTKLKKHVFLNKASVYLLRAKELSENFNLKGGDREHFFLSLTYDLLGEKQLALEQLSQIPADSQFKSDSEKLKGLLIQQTVKH